MNTPIEVGTTVRTRFLRGHVTEVINGTEKKWQATEYYRVKVVRPVWAGSDTQIIRLDEVIESGMEIKEFGK